MNTDLIDIGFGNAISAHRIVSIVLPDSAPVKRVISRARGDGKLMDATCGRKVRSVIVTDSAHVILSSVKTTTIKQRYIDEYNNIIN